MRNTIALLLSTAFLLTTEFALTQTSKPQEKKMEEKTPEKKSPTVVITPELKSAIMQMKNAGITPGINPLTYTECIVLGGTITGSGACSGTGSICITVDSAGHSHMQCITD